MSDAEEASPTALHAASPLSAILPILPRLALMWNSMNGFHVKHWNLLVLKKRDEMSRQFSGTGIHAPDESA